jgi:hypothetical protein
MAENSRAGDSPVLHALCVTNEFDVARATLSIAAAGLAPLWAAAVLAFCQAALAGPCGAFARPKLPSLAAPRFR